MTIYFLRHAEAEHEAGTDFERKLTPKGVEQAGRVGQFLARAGIRPDLIITSPVVRARQTAEIVSRAAKATLVEGQWLACGMGPETCLREIAAHWEKSSVLLVGHEPDFSSAIAECLGLPDPGTLKIRKSSLAAIDLVEPRSGCGQLQFLIPARLMS